MTQPNILFIILDCLRADRFEREAFAALRGSGCHFERAYTPIATTTPSVATMLTGLYPFEHGIVSLTGYKLRECCASLPELLSAAGYDTLAFVTGPLLPETGLDRGFATYRYRHEGQYLQSQVRQEIAQALNGARRPWFALLHLWELHEPVFERPSLLKRLLRRLAPSPTEDDSAYAARYERCLPLVAEAVRDLLGRVPGVDLLVVLGDHGERLTEPVREDDAARCRWRPRHGFNVHDYLLHIPLLMAGPRLPRRRLGQPVSTLDLLPTTCELAGLAAPRGLSGRSLAPLMLGGEDGLRPSPLWCGASGVILKEQANWLEGLREDRYKYVFEPYAAKPHEWLYDLEADPAEGRNLAAERREVAQAMHRRLEELKASRSGQADQMDAAEDALVRAKLEDLGYI